MTNQLPTGALEAARTPRWLQRERSGVRLTDENGHRCIAFHCAGGVFNLGFGAREIAEAVGSFMQQHDMGMWFMPSERRLAGEEQFARLLPRPLERTFYTSSASEAFEVACKLAKRVTGRSELVSVTRGYYGHIGFAMAMDDPAFSPDRYQPLAGGRKKAIYGSIESLEALIDDDTAAICLESIQVPAGVFVPPEGYLGQVRQLCDARGILLVIDEVQGGLLRTGRTWAIDHDGVTPDLLVCGKGLSGGYYPVGAVSMSEAHHRHLHSEPTLHRSSYSGGEIAARLSGLIADRYLDPALGAHVNARGDQLAAGLRRLQARYPAVLLPEIRGRGLVRAMDVADPSRRARLFEACHEAGLYIKGTSMNPAAVIFMPPLVITAAEMDEALASLETALSRMD